MLWAAGLVLLDAPLLVLPAGLGLLVGGQMLSAAALCILEAGDLVLSTAGLGLLGAGQEVLLVAKVMLWAAGLCLPLLVSWWSELLVWCSGLLAGCCWVSFWWSCLLAWSS